MIYFEAPSNTLSGKLSVDVVMKMIRGQFTQFSIEKTLEFSITVHETEETFTVSEELVSIEEEEVEISTRVEENVTDQVDPIQEQVALFFWKEFKK